MKRHSLKTGFVCGFLLVFLLFSFSFADEKSDKVDKLFARWDSTVSPGAALAVIKDGKIIHKRGYGMANLEHNIPITTTSIFRIGSTSKQFTAACIAILSLQGKISLDDNIRKYIPEMPEYDKPITIRHMIHHISGMRDYTGLLPLAGFRADADAPTIEETIEIISRQKGLDFSPGERYSYCNSGYFLQSIIVERVSGKSMNEFAQENLFKPLGMKNTFFHQDHTKIIKNRAAGYSPTKDGFRIDMTNWMQVGDGGIYTTVEDLFLWDQAFYNNKLGKEFIDLIQTMGVLNNGEKLDYAFGLRIAEYKGLKTVGHSGSWVGYRSAIIRFPKQKFSVVCLANLSAMNPSNLCRQITDIYLTDQLKEEPKEESEKEVIPIQISKEELEEKTGNYHDKESGRWVSVTVEKDKLKVDMNGREFLLSPVSEASFQALGARFDASLDFLPEERGKARKAKLNFRGDEIKLVRTGKVSPLMPDKLRAYEGEYYSDELMATYRIIMKEGSLYSKLRSTPHIPLKIMAEDKFVSGRRGIDFTRDRRKRINGFILRIGSMNFKFLKK